MVKTETRFLVCLQEHRLQVGFHFFWKKILLFQDDVQFQVSSKTVYHILQLRVDATGFTVAQRFIVTQIFQLNSSNNHSNYFTIDCIY